MLKKKTHGYERKDNHPKPRLTQWKAAIIDPHSRVDIYRPSSLTLTVINLSCGCVWTNGNSLDFHEINPEKLALCGKDT